MNLLAARLSPEPRRRMPDTKPVAQLESLPRFLELPPESLLAVKVPTPGIGSRCVSTRELLTSTALSLLLRTSLHSRWEPLSILISASGTDERAGST